MFLDTASALLRHLFKTKSRDVGYVYVIRTSKHADAALKIGRSRSPKSRLKHARTWLPDAHFVEVWQFDDMFRAESYIHRALAGYRTQGEHFDYRCLGKIGQVCLRLGGKEGSCLIRLYMHLALLSAFMFQQWVREAPFFKSSGMVFLLNIWLL